jgi:hypothetical protein
MGIRTVEGQQGRRRAMSEAEYRKLEQYVMKMKRLGYSYKAISQSVPLTAQGVRHMVERLQAQGAEGS